MNGVIDLIQTENKEKSSKGLNWLKYINYLSLVVKRRILCV
jgi:hypothetical protein